MQRVTIDSGSRRAAAELKQLLPHKFFGLLVKRLMSVCINS
jgi:hypothetical protein